MSDFFLIVITASVVTGLIYFIYLILLQSSSKPKNAKPNLQITTEDICEQVRILYNQKKYSIVEKLAAKYLDKNPNHDELRVLLAKSMFHNDKIYDAMKHAILVLKHVPTNLSVRTFLASCYVRIGQSSKAIQELKEVLRFDSENVAAMKELANIYLENNERQSAIKIFNKILNYTSSNLDVLNIKMTIARLYGELEDYQAAIGEYKSILEIYPEDSASKKNLIQLYILTDNERKAIEMCETLLNACTDQHEQLWILSNLIDLLLRINKTEKALEYAKVALANPFSDKLKLKEKVAEILCILGRMDEGIAMLTELSKENMNSVEVKKALAKSYQAKKDYMAATEIYKEILDAASADEIPTIHREISNIYGNWAMDYFDQEKNAECFKTFSIAFHYDNENPRLFYKLGLVNQLILNYNEAIEQYRRAIELDSTNPTYYMALTECYEAINNAYEQKKAILEALSYDDQNPVAHYKLGILNMEQRDGSNAIEAFRRAIALDGKMIDAQYRLALLLEAQGETAEAINLYEDILLLDPKNESARNCLKMLKPESLMVKDLSIKSAEFKKDN